MVDEIRGPAPKAPQPALDQVALAGAAAPPAAQAGIAAEPLLSVETVETGAGDGVQAHECEPPAPGADLGAATPMQNLHDRGWDATCDIFAIIHRALAEAGKAQADMQEQMNTVETQDLQNFIESQSDLADDTAKLARSQGIAQAIGGAVQGAGAFGGGWYHKSPSLSGAWNSAGQSAASIGGGIESAADAGVQKQIKLEETYSSVAETARQKSAGLRERHGSSFDKVMSAQDQVRQQNQTSVNAAVDGLRNRA